MTYSIPNSVIDFAKAIQEAGGRALLVGGCVRDMLLHIVPKDFDIEIYGIEPDVLHAVAEKFGEVTDAGKAFGILKLQIDPLLLGSRSDEDSPSLPRRGLGGGLELDLGIPRHDSKIGAGHKGFDVDVDPFMAPEQAARRRDFTVNAIMMDPLTQEIIDPYQGAIDLQNHVLRVVDVDSFGDDPLRILRGIQFAARFELVPDEATFAVMRSITPRLIELSPERLRDEWRKLLVLAQKPSIGLQLGFDLGVYHVLHPELPPLKETPQHPAWHPEGDVWIHTLLVVDEMVLIVEREELSSDVAFPLMLAALVHDFGKPLCTRMVDGIWRSTGHEQAGEAPARSFLRAVGVSSVDTERIVGIVKDHMKPTNLYQQEVQTNIPVTDGTIRKLAARIAPATMNELLLVAEADFFGRGQWQHGEKRAYPEREWLLAHASVLEVLTGPAPHVLSGEELKQFGVEPGPRMGDMIREADCLRDDEGLQKEEIIRRMFPVA